MYNQQNIQMLDYKIKNKSKQSSSEHKRNNRIFGVLLLTTEILLVFIFGFFIKYSQIRSIGDDHFIIAAMFMLSLLGFGLLTCYIKQSALISISHIIIMLGLSMQLYFPIRGLWEIINVSGESWLYRTDNNILPISITNVLNDRQVSQMLQSSSLTDYIACYISLIIAYSGVIGRVDHLQVYVMTVIGTILYELSSMILWRLFITDCGFGMRIFIFGGVYGLVCSIILGSGTYMTKDINHHVIKQTPKQYKSSYYQQSLALIGSIIIFSSLPILCWNDLYHNNKIGTDNIILYPAILNVWFALFGGVMGSVCWCLLKFDKLDIHVIIFSCFAGGIGYLSSSDIVFNPGVALGVGFCTSCISAWGIQWLKSTMNSNGIYDSNGIVGSFMIPGLISGILSAIFQSSQPTPIGTFANYANNTDSTRTGYNQGAYQMAGVGITLACGIFPGLFAGILGRVGGSSWYSKGKEIIDDRINKRQ